MYQKTPTVLDFSNKHNRRFWGWNVEQQQQPEQAKNFSTLFFSIFNDDVVNIFSIPISIKWPLYSSRFEATTARKEQSCLTHLVLTLP